MKAAFSPYLLEVRPALRELIRLLRRDYDYVSVLASDTAGLSVCISQRAKSVSGQTIAVERGVVVRVYKNGQYAEYAFNDFDPRDPAAKARELRGALEAQLALLKAAGVKPYETPVLPDEPQTLFVEKEAGTLPEDADVQAVVEKLGALSDRGMSLNENALDCMINAESTHVCKMFLTEKRDLCQSYVYSVGAVLMILNREGNTQVAYDSVSGLCGTELFDRIGDKLEAVAALGADLLGAGRIEPGEYEIITSPEVSGLIAHEAFGHGVEMDMFVKNRALGADYLGQRVGSELCAMHEGALCAEDVSAYAFDDEGTLAGDVTEIDRGILKTGVCDALSALRLGVRPTGNGKRENFEHKAYARMTHTMFDSGEDSLEDMIASVRDGFLLEGIESGMEDPKHWGIQCIVKLGREIKDGKLTGRTVAPIIMTGYVPELLGSISMASPHRESFGSGYCGKGHKELVKVADGGPYLKMKARLG